MKGNRKVPFIYKEVDMAVYRNVTKGSLFFGRFKLKTGEVVPCVDFTDVEQADIERFLKKGILVEEKTETPIAKEKAPEVTSTEETSTEETSTEETSKEEPKHKKGK